MEATIVHTDGIGFRRALFLLVKEWYWEMKNDDAEWISPNKIVA